MVLIVTDLEHYIIPDIVHIILASISIPLGIINNYPLYSMCLGSLSLSFGAIIIRWLFMVARGKDALGIGDIKLFAVSGLYVALYQIPLFLFLTGTIGVLTALLWKKIGKGEIFPFGPAIAVSMFICMLDPMLIYTYIF
jgi:leader peptidase (prepilin peptidase)/N-methyltransferase